MGRKKTKSNDEQPTVEKSLDFDNLPLTYRGVTIKNVERILDVAESNDILECSVDTNPSVIKDFLKKKSIETNIKIIPFSQY